MHAGMRDRLFLGLQNLQKDDLGKLGLMYISLHSVGLFAFVLTTFSSSIEYYIYLQILYLTTKHNEG